jgi:hypothetical protein
MPDRRWHRVEDPWDTLPSPDPPDERASPLQVGEYLRWVGVNASLAKITEARARSISARRHFGDDEQAIVLRHLVEPHGDPFMLGPAPYPPRGGSQQGYPSCPRPRIRWGVSKLTGADFSFAVPCGKWACIVCGEDSRWTRVAEAVHRFDAEVGLWVATAPTDSETTARYRQRRHAHRPVRDLVVRRHDGVKHFYVSVALPGREPPLEGTWMVIDDALRHLRDVALAPPGQVQKVRWTGDWPALPAEDLGPRITVDLGPYDADLQQRVRDATLQRAVDMFGIDPEDENWRDHTPRGWVADTMQRILDALQADDGEDDDEVGW